MFIFTIAGICCLDLVFIVIIKLSKDAAGANDDFWFAFGLLNAVPLFMILAFSSVPYEKGIIEASIGSALCLSLFIILVKVVKSCRKKLCQA